MKKFFAEFKTFIMRGNVLNMAVGIIIGGAFTAIVTALTDNILQPILNAIFGNPNEGWTAVNAVTALITAILNFLITALVLFLIIKAVNKAMSLGKKKEAPAAPTTKICPFCKSEIHIDATRCPHCTAEQPKKA